MSRLEYALMAVIAVCAVAASFLAPAPARDGAPEAPPRNEFEMSGESDTQEEEEFKIEWVPECRWREACAETGKPAFVLATDDSGACAPCNYLRDKCLTDEEVVRTLQRFVVVKLEPDRRDLWGRHGTPYGYFCDPPGSIHHRGPCFVRGKITPQRFITFLLEGWNKARPAPTEETNEGFSRHRPAGRQHVTQCPA